MNPRSGRKGEPIFHNPGWAGNTGEFDITEFDREDMVIVGTPDEIITKLMRYEEAGVDQLLCYLNFGYLPLEAIMRSIELLGTKVIPELKRRGAMRLAQGLEEQIRNAEFETDPGTLWADDVKIGHTPD